MGREDFWADVLPPPSALRRQGGRGIVAVFHPTQVIAVNGHDRNNIPVAAGACVLRRSLSDIERVLAAGDPM